jgi:transposase
MAALTVSRGKSPQADLFHRLRARGKEFKVAIVAVARKILTVVNAVVRSGQALDPACQPLALTTTKPNHEKFSLEF